MLREHILGNVPAWAVEWNTLVLPLIVSVISAVSFAYKAASNREERRIKKHEAHKAKCEAIKAQMLICRDCISGAVPVSECGFEHQPSRCPKKLAGVNP